MTKILFVCHGNICRSPMAEFILKDMVKKAGAEKYYEIASAAVSDEEQGNPVYPPAAKKLAEHGIGCKGKTARQLRPEDYAEYELIIGMDRGNMAAMRRIVRSENGGKLHLLAEYTDQPCSEVSDPWYTRDFDAAWRDISKGCDGLFKILEKERNKACT